MPKLLVNGTIDEFFCLTHGSFIGMNYPEKNTFSMSQMATTDWQEATARRMYFPFTARL